MKSTFTILMMALLLSPIASFSQQTHTVGAKETLFSIGRQYNIHPRELAAFNKIPFETGLTIGQVLKIPAQKTMTPVTTPVENSNSANTDLKSNSNSKAETNTTQVKTEVVANLSPIYHTVLKKENLFQIRMKYNKVSIDSIKKWNNLENESLSEGMRLIVGYENSNVNNNNTTNNTSFEKYPVSSNANSDFKTNRANTLEKDETPSFSTISPTPGPKVTTEGGGYFKTAFETQSAAKNNSVEEEGKAAAFKSTSGWDDGKYYCLHNTAPSGTIVKVTNKLNQKVIYAKVLDVIPDITQNKGIFLRLSKAGAEELGVTEEQFDAIVSY
jgi:LysM repeat protein